MLAAFVSSWLPLVPRRGTLQTDTRDHTFYMNPYSLHNGFRRATFWSNGDLAIDKSFMWLAP